MSSSFRRATRKALLWIVLFMTAVASVSGQSEADFLARVRTHSRNANLSDRLERAFARALRNGRPTQVRGRPEPPDASGPNAGSWSTVGPDATVPTGLGGAPGSPGPDVIDGESGGSPTPPDWSIAFPGQATTEAPTNTPDLFNWKANSPSESGNGGEIFSSTSATVVDPWAKIFGSTVAGRVDTTTSDFLQRTDGAPQPPTDHQFGTTTEASWEIATDSGFGPNVETTTENVFGARFETTTEQLRGFGGGAFETTNAPEIHATNSPTLFPGFGAGFETTTINPFPQFPGFGATPGTLPPFPGFGPINTPNTLPPFPGFGAINTAATLPPFPGLAGAFQATNAPEKIATDPSPALPLGFVSGVSSSGPNVQIPGDAEEEKWRNKGPPPVPELTRKLCEDNAATAAKYGIKDIISWVDNNCTLARTVFKGRSCEDFSKSARWCYA